MHAPSNSSSSVASVLISEAAGREARRLSEQGRACFLFICCRHMLEPPGWIFLPLQPAAYVQSRLAKLKLTFAVLCRVLCFCALPLTYLYGCCCRHEHLCCCLPAASRCDGIHSSGWHEVFLPCCMGKHRCVKNKHEVERDERGEWLGWGSVQLRPVKRVCLWHWVFPCL